MSTRVEVLVLDGQGVVFSDPFAAVLDDLADATGQPRDVVAGRWQREVRVRAWRGEIDDATLWTALAAGAPGSWSARLADAYRPGPAAPWLRAWGSRVPIWLLSNHRTAWLDARLERFGLTACFARRLVSDATGALKPEAAAFRPVLAAVSCPAAALFVDDQARNVAAASALGLTALLARPDGAWVHEVTQRLAR